MPNENKIAGYHVGLSLLKVLMCLEVVWAHCAWSGVRSAWTAPLYEVWTLAVPAFMLTSFALARRMFEETNVHLFVKRLRRLALPLVMWGAVYCLVYLLMDGLLETDRMRGVEDFFWQALTGHRENVNPSMWFQFDLIILTVIFFFVIRCSQKIVPVYVVAGLMFLCALMMQYTGWNHDLFDNLRFELKYPLGRLCEMIPYASIGIILACVLPAKNPDISLSLKMKYPRITVFLTGVAFMALCALPWPKTEGFYYAGVRLLVCSVAIYFVFNSLSPNLFPVIVRRGIVNASRYVLGIYCVHRLVGYLLEVAFKQLGLPMVSDYIFVGIVAVISLSLCMLLSRMPFAVCRQMAQ